MNRKIPPEALSVYLGMGPGRSYESVARHYGASKRAVVDRAKKEDWQGRVAKMELAAREKAEAKAGHSLEEMNDRHLKTAQLIQRKGLEALSRLPIEEPMDAVRALKIGLDHECLSRGEPSERSVAASCWALGEGAADSQAVLLGGTSVVLNETLSAFRRPRRAMVR